MTAEDAYYQCTDASCAAFPVQGSTETSQDWEPYVTDDDPYSPMCTPFEYDSPINVSLS